MFKSILKEIMIILLLIIAILLILGILFYDYRPTAKIPSKVAEYSLPTEMKEELNETMEAVKTQNIIQTYRIDGSDLKRYERTDQYNAGRVNPFDKISSEETSGDNNGGSNSNSSTSNNTQGGKLYNTSK